MYLTRDSPVFTGASDTILIAELRIRTNTWHKGTEGATEQANANLIAHFSHQAQALSKRIPLQRLLVNYYNDFARICGYFIGNSRFISSSNHVY